MNFKIKNKFFFAIFASAFITACEGEIKEEEKITPVISIEATEYNCNENMPEIMDKLKDESAIDSFLTNCEQYKTKKKAMSLNIKTTGNKISDY